MRIRCTRCDEKVIVRSSREMSRSLRQLYCICRNPECGHSFVMDLSFSHTLSPSALDLPEAVRESLQSKTPPEIVSLFSLLAGG